jgi:hypothetical protein
MVFDADGADQVNPTVNELALVVVTVVAPVGVAT